MEDLENHLARLGCRGEARDPEYWQVAQVGGPEPKRYRRRRSTPRVTGGRRDLYMWILQTSQMPNEPYRVTRLAE